MRSCYHCVVQALRYQDGGPAHGVDAKRFEAKVARCYDGYGKVCPANDSLVEDGPTYAAGAMDKPGEWSGSYGWYPQWFHLGVNCGYQRSIVGATVDVDLRRRRVVRPLDMAGGFGSGPQRLFQA